MEAAITGEQAANLVEIRLDDERLGTGYEDERLGTGYEFERSQSALVGLDRNPCDQFSLQYLSRQNYSLSPSLRNFFKVLQGHDHGGRDNRYSTQGLQVDMRDYRMTFSFPRIASWFATTIFVIVSSSAPAWAQFGLAVAGVGPINRSMGGAAVAAPIDAAGALFWNPATIGGLERSEMVFGTELLIPRTTITSRVGAGTFGPTTLAGTTGGNNGVFPLPTFALVYRPTDKESPWTYGIGFFEIGGFGTNYRSAAPILSSCLRPPSAGAWGRSIPSIRSSRLRLAWRIS